MIYVYDVILTFHMKHNLKSYMMSYVNDVTYDVDIIYIVYDILYDIFTDSARFKCCPGPAQIQQDLNQMQALLVPYVCLSVLASK